MLLVSSFITPPPLSVIRHSGAVTPVRGCANPRGETCDNLALPSPAMPKENFRGDIHSRPQLIHDGRLLSKIDGRRRVAGEQRIFLARWLISHTSPIRQSLQKQLEDNAQKNILTTYIAYQINNLLPGRYHSRFEERRERNALKMATAEPHRPG